MAANNKHAAYQYMLGPLSEPTPNEETGLGASFRVAPPKPIVTSDTGSSASTNPFRRGASERKNGSQVHVRSVSNPTDRSQSSHRAAAFGSFEEDYRPRSSDQPRPSQRHQSRLHHRASSLQERYPGDPSVRPLEVLTREAKLANRSPHLRRRHRAGTDSIDRLDATCGKYGYHHEGPYDAALFARNSSWKHSPIAALDHSNNETLNATAPENIQDAVEKHRPLDGVALVPPGEKDMFGRVYQYEEGPNMMLIEGANYKRWPGIEYHPDDIKGKGEPSYTIEKALKEHKQNKQLSQGEAPTYELIDFPSKSHDSQAFAGERDALLTNGQSTAHRLSSGLRKRVGSLRKKMQSISVE